MKLGGSLDATQAEFREQSTLVDRLQKSRTQHLARIRPND